MTPADRELGDLSDELPVSADRETIKSTGEDRFPVSQREEKLIMMKRRTVAGVRKLFGGRQGG